MKHSTRGLARESTVMLLSSASAGVLITLISIFVARSVTVEDFGVYSVVTSIQSVASMVAGLSVGSALAKYISEYRARNIDRTGELAKTGIIIVLAISSVTSVGYIAMSQPIGDWLYEEQSIVSLIPYSALVVFGTAMFATVFGIAQGCQNMAVLGTMRAGSPLIGLVLVFALLPIFDLRGVFLALGIAQLAVAIVALYWLNRNTLSILSPKVKLKSSDSARKILGYAVPTVISASLVGPVYWLGNTELAIWTGFDAVGLFGIAFILFQGFIILPNSIVIPLVPRVSNSSVMSMENVRTMIVDSIRVASVLLFPLVLGAGLFAGPIIETVFGTDYSGAATSTYLMAVASFFFAQGVMVGAMLAGLGRVWLGLSINIIWAASFIALSTGMIPVWGEVGLAGSYALSYALLLGVSFLACKVKLNIDLRKAYPLPAVASLVFVVGYAGIADIFDFGWASRGLLLLSGCLVVILGERKLVVSLLRKK